MGDLELGLLIIVSWLPVSFLFLLLSWTAARISLRDLYTFRLAARRRWHSVRLFECAAVTRRTAQLRLSVLTLHLLGLAILYDLDLFILMPETLLLERWGIVQAVITFCYAGLIIGALSFDERQRGFYWQA